ncbi:hypothetical protein D3C75_1090300 [compost metagenome]
MAVRSGLSNSKNNSIGFKLITLRPLYLTPTDINMLAGRLKSGNTRSSQRCQTGDRF